MLGIFGGSAYTSVITEAVIHRCYTKNCFEKLRQDYRISPVPGYLFNKAATLKCARLVKQNIPAKLFPIGFCKIFKSTFCRTSSGNCICKYKARVWSLVFNPSRSGPDKIKRNFYFHTSLGCLKKFYEGPKALKLYLLRPLVLLHFHDSC